MDPIQFTVTVLSMNGDRLNVPVSPETTIEDVKKTIRDKSKPKNEFVRGDRRDPEYISKFLFFVVFFQEKTPTIRQILSFQNEQIAPYTKILDLKNIRETPVIHVSPILEFCF